MAERQHVTHANQFGPAHVFRVKPLEIRIEAPDALIAKRCECEYPQTYQDEDGERRCLCGRAV